MLGRMRIDSERWKATELTLQQALLFLCNLSVGKSTK